MFLLLLFSMFFALGLAGGMCMGAAWFEPIYATYFSGICLTAAVLAAVGLRVYG